MGVTSFVDWAMFTWSLGWTSEYSPRRPPSSSIARFAITSFAFMFCAVPAPIWNASIGNCASHVPSATSCAARAIASAVLGSSRPRAALTSAAARLIVAVAAMNARGSRRPLMGKFSIARTVWEP